MRTETEPTEANQQYASAYAAHYTGRDLPLALQLYRKLMASHPSAQEAGYARMQVQNMVNAVVPRQELLDAQIELLLVHFERDERLHGGRPPGTQLSEDKDQVQREGRGRDDGSQESRSLGSINQLLSHAIGLHDSPMWVVTGCGIAR